MASRNRPSHDKYNLSYRQNARKLELEKEQAELQAKQRRASIDAFLINTTAHIYSGLVAKEWDGGEPNVPHDVLLNLAKLAKDSANALGESLGFLSPRVVETPAPVDEVVERPVKPVIIEDEQAPTDSDVKSMDSVVASETPTITLESVEQ